MKFKLNDTNRYEPFVFGEFYVDAWEVALKNPLFKPVLSLDTYAQIMSRRHFCDSLVSLCEASSIDSSPWLKLSCQTIIILGEYIWSLCFAKQNVSENTIPLALENLEELRSRLKRFSIVDDQSAFEWLAALDAEIEKQLELTPFPEDVVLPGAV